MSVENSVHSSQQIYLKVPWLIELIFSAVNESDIAILSRAISTSQIFQLNYKNGIIVL